jgi:stage II sporulation protein D
VGRKETWNAVKSCNFKIIQGKGYVILDGKGSGHGVGMCQWGAEGMARRGFTYKQILYHYYPGTVIKYD